MGADNSEHPEEKEDGDPKAWLRQQHEAHLSTLHALKNEFARSREQADAADRKRQFREYLTIWLVMGTFAATAVADGIFYFTMKDARHAASVSHQDASDALNVVRTNDAEQSAQTYAALRVAQTQADNSGIQAGASKSQADSAKESLTQNSRAWLNPEQVTVTNEGAGNYTVHLMMVNTGHTPAFDIGNSVRIYEMDYEQRLGMTQIPSPVADICSGTQPTKSGEIVYPTPGGFGTGGHTYTYPVQNTSDEPRIFTVCFVYKTLGVIHRSAVCEFSDMTNGDKARKPFEQASWRFCTNGNYAD